jgi:drug/metabolite transporter (DMT)-like permease
MNDPRSQNHATAPTDASGQSSTPRSDMRKVIPWMAVAVVSLTVMALSVRETGRSLGIFEVLALRNIFTVAVMLTAALAVPSLASSLRTRSMQWHLLRNTIQGAGQYAWALAIVMLPLAQVFALEFATPLLTAILAVLILGERMTLWRVVSVLAGVCGVVVINQGSVGMSGWSSALPLAAALCFALSDIVTKRLTRTETSFAIIFWMNAIQMPMNLAGSEWGFWTKLDWSLAPPVLGVCIAGSLGHYAMTQALRHGDAIVVVPMGFLRIPLVAVLGGILYGETVGFFLVLGSSILAVGVLTGLWAESRRQRPRTPTPSVDCKSSKRHDPNEDHVANGANSFGDLRDLQPLRMPFSGC